MIDINFANAQVEPWSNNINLYLAVKSANSIAVVSNVAFSQYEEGQTVPTPESFKLTPQSAQVLMDALFRAGIRPSEQASVNSQVAAIKYHLEDMRRLAFPQIEGNP